MPSRTTGLPCSLSDCSAWPPLAQPVSWVCFPHHFLLFWKDSLPGQPHLLCGLDSRLAVCWRSQTESSHLFFPFQLFTNFMNRSYIFIVKPQDSINNQHKFLLPSWSCICLVWFFLEGYSWSLMTPSRGAPVPENRNGSFSSIFLQMCHIIYILIFFFHFWSFHDKIERTSFFLYF